MLPPYCMNRGTGIGIMSVFFKTRLKSDGRRRQVRPTAGSAKLLSMQHLQILLGFFVLFTGGVAIAQLIAWNRRHPIPFLRAFVRFLIILNTYFFLQTILYYYLSIVRPGISPRGFFLINALTDLLFSLLLLFVTWLAISLAHTLASRPVDRWLAGVFGVVSLLTVAGHTGVLIHSVPRMDSRPLFLIMLFYVVILHLGVITAFLWNRRQTRRTLPPAQAALYARIAWVVLGIKSLSLVCMGLFHLALIPVNISFYAVFLLYNLLPILFVDRITAVMFPNTPAPVPQATGTDLATRCAGYGISKREQEVIGLILQGFSNRDIEERLFISMSTVKDHIYKIYKKTGVRNRVQLVNLFTSTPR